LNFDLNLWRLYRNSATIAAQVVQQCRPWRNSATSLQFRLKQSVVAVLTAVEDVYAVNLTVEKDEEVVA